jgi:hypothetical protein
MPHKELRETSTSSAQDTGKKRVDLTRLLAQKTGNNDQLKGKAHMTQKQEQTEKAIQQHNDLLAKFAIAEERRGTPPFSGNNVPLGRDRHRYGGIGGTGQSEAGKYAQEKMGAEQYQLYLNYAAKRNYNRNNPDKAKKKPTKAEKAASNLYIKLKEEYKPNNANNEVVSSQPTNNEAGSSRPTNNEAGSSRPTTGQLSLTREDIQRRDYHAEWARNYRQSHGFE